MPYKNLKLKRIHQDKMNLLKRGEFKVCKRCGIEKHESNFLKRTDVPGKHNRRRENCRECRIISLFEWRLKNIFGLSLAEFNSMKKEQNNLCAICNKEMKRICVDHNHETGEIRGLLCVQCNAMLGQAKEKPETFKSAIAYLAKWGRI